MVQNLNYKNTTKQENLYGWYPGGQRDAPRDSKDIYCKLGTRPPRDQSYCEAEILYRYHQSIKPSELIYKSKQTVEDALKPPWSLHLKTNPDLSESAEKTIPEAFSPRRTQSAPATRNVPTQRIILKIPTPQFYNLFDGEAEEHFNSHVDKHENKIVIPTVETINENIPQTVNNSNKKIEISELIPPEQYKLLKLNDDSQVIFEKSSPTAQQTAVEQQSPKNNTPEVVENKQELSIDAKKLIIAHNLGKKPLVTDEPVKEIAKLILRPKTANPGFQRSYSSASMKPKLKDRPKSSAPGSKAAIITQSFNIEKRTETVNKSLQEFLTEPKTSPTGAESDNRNSPTSLHQLIMSHTTSQLQTVSPFNNYGNTHNVLSKAKSTTNLNINYNNTQKATADATVLYVEPSWVDNYLNKNKLKNDVKLVDGNWRDQIINRSKFLHKRPSYYVKINVDKLKPDPPAPEVHYKASDTYFYNTMPTKKMTFTVDPHFISENLNVKKVELQNRPPSSTGSAIRYRKDFAFAY